MTKTIARLWMGDLAPIEYFGRSNAELRRLWSLTERNWKTLEETLDPAQKDLAKRYAESAEECDRVCQEQAFCDGFCLGSRLMAEALTGGSEGL